jgi:mRNA-degrading endonuclease YafQ of YafQ-DinJ toxin-antitoxin module
MTYRLVTPEYFLRRSRKFLRKHPELKPKFADTMEKLRRDPFQAPLRLYPLHGDLAGIHAVSLTHSYRITLTLKVTEHEILLLDIGSHDEVYG